MVQAWPMFEEARALGMGKPGQFTAASGLRGKRTYRVIFKRDRNTGFGSHIEVCGTDGKPKRYASIGSCYKAAIALAHSGVVPDQDNRSAFWHPELGFFPLAGQESEKRQ